MRFVWRKLSRRAILEVRQLRLTVLFEQENPSYALGHIMHDMSDHLGIYCSREARTAVSDLLELEEVSTYCWYMVRGTCSEPRASGPSVACFQFLLLVAIRINRFLKYSLPASASFAGPE